MSQLLFTCFKTSLGVQPFILKCGFLARSLLCKSSTFPYERLCARTQFETEVKRNLEMAYLIPVCTVIGYLWHSHVN